MQFHTLNNKTAYTDDTKIACYIAVLASYTSKFKAKNNTLILLKGYISELARGIVGVEAILYHIGASGVWLHLICGWTCKTTFRVAEEGQSVWGLMIL